MLQHIEVKNRHNMELLEHCKPNTIFITISDIGEKAVDCRAFKEAMSVCYTWFDDVDFGDSGEITDKEAASMAEFIKRYKDRADNLIVNCNGGVSRSAAVAAVVMKYLGMNDMLIWGNGHYSPNVTVYNRLAKQFFGDEIATDEFRSELKRKIELNISIWRRLQGLD